MSGLQSLRTLELPALSVGQSAGDISFFPKVLSLIAPESRPPPNIVLIYDQSYFIRRSGGINRKNWDGSRFDKYQKDRFKRFVQASIKCTFRLVLCAEVAGSELEEATRALEEDVKEFCSRRFEFGPLTRETVVSNSTIVSTIPRIDHVVEKADYLYPERRRRHEAPVRSALQVISNASERMFK